MAHMRAVAARLSLRVRSEAAVRPNALGGAVGQLLQIIFEVRAAVGTRRYLGNHGICKV